MTEAAGTSGLLYEWSPSFSLTNSCPFTTCCRQKVSFWNDTVTLKCQQLVKKASLCASTGGQQAGQETQEILEFEQDYDSSLFVWYREVHEVLCFWLCACSDGNILKNVICDGNTVWKKPQGTQAALLPATWHHELWKKRFHSPSHAFQATRQEF